MLVRKAPREDGGRDQIYRQRDAKHCQQMNGDYGRVMGQILSQSSSSVSSVTQSCLTLYDPMDCITPASLPITNNQSLLKLISIESVMPCNHLILCRPLFLLPSIFQSIRVFSNESVLRIRYPKYWSFSVSISPSNEHSGLISFRTAWASLLSKEFSRVLSNTTVQKHQFFSTQFSL